MSKKKKWKIIIILLVLIALGGFYYNYTNGEIAKTTSYKISENEIGSYIRYSKLKYDSLFGTAEWKDISDTDKEKDQLIKNTIQNVVLTKNHIAKNQELKIAPKKNEKIKIDEKDKEVQAMLKEYNLTADFIIKAAEDEYNDQIYENYMKSKIKISEKQIREYYKKHKAEYTQYYADMYQIWIKTDKNGETAKQIADKAYTEIRKGENFDKVIQKYSQDKERGYIGYVAEDTLLKPIREKFLKMEKGDVSKPIETGEGYFIVKIGNKNKVIKTYSSVKEEIRAKIKQDRYYKSEEDYLKTENIRYKKYKFRRLDRSF